MSTFAPGELPVLCCSITHQCLGRAPRGAGLLPGWHTLSVSAASQLPSLPAGRAGQSTASTLSFSWLPASLMHLQPGEPWDSAMASGMGRSSPPALTAHWC